MHFPALVNIYKALHTGVSVYRPKSIQYLELSSPAQLQVNFAQAHGRTQDQSLVGSFLLQFLLVFSRQNSVTL